MNTEFTERLSRIESALQSFLPESSNTDWQTLSFGILDKSINAEHIQNLITPCRTLINLGGKRWRPLLCGLCAELVADAKNQPQQFVENAYSLAPLIEFAHNASLIHDDIEDGADTRRGMPAAHITYGMDTAINAASWLYFQASVCIKKSTFSAERKLALYELFLEELRRLHLGQAMDIMWHRNPDFIPSQSEYTAMVKNKTGTLARLAVKTGILCGGGTEQEANECGAIAENIGTGFQIIDDVTNLTTGNPGKKRGDDIVEGKKSLPVILHLESCGSDREKLANLFVQAGKEGINSSAVEQAIELLNESGAVQKASEYGTRLIKQKVGELVSYFGNSDSESAVLIQNLFAGISKKGK